jgi:hypothetical protein
MFWFYSSMRPQEAQNTAEPADQAAGLRPLTMISRQRDGFQITIRQGCSSKHCRTTVET